MIFTSWILMTVVCGFDIRPVDTEARIVRIKSNGLIVFVPK